MAKRFVDTGRFFDPWYRSLSPAHKVFWEFLISSCDLAGAWKKDFALAGFVISATPETISPDQTLEVLNKGKVRIVEFGDYWFVVDFIPFQYGKLKSSCPPHRAVISCLEGHIGRGLNRKYAKISSAPAEEGGQRWANPPKTFKRFVRKLSEEKSAK